MSQIITSRKWASFIYDFDINGGAVGTIDMGVFIPTNCIIWYGYAKVITTCVGGAGAKISIGFTGFDQVLITKTAVASWTANAILPGLDLPELPQTVSNVQMQITISDAPLTAGKIVYGFLYTVFNGNTSGNLPTGRGIGFDIIGSTLKVY